MGDPFPVKRSKYSWEFNNSKGDQLPLRLIARPLRGAWQVMFGQRRARIVHLPAIGRDPADGRPRFPFRFRLLEQLRTNFRTAAGDGLGFAAFHQLADRMGTRRFEQPAILRFIRNASSCRIRSAKVVRKSASSSGCRSHSGNAASLMTVAPICPARGLKIVEALVEGLDGRIERRSSPRGRMRAVFDKKARVHRARLRPLVPHLPGERDARAAALSSTVH
jgi:hypothetical protein